MCRRDSLLFTYAFSQGNQNGTSSQKGFSKHCRALHIILLASTSPCNVENSRLVRTTLPRLRKVLVFDQRTLITPTVTLTLLEAQNTGLGVPSLIICGTELIGPNPTRFEIALWETFVAALRVRNFRVFYVFNPATERLLGRQEDGNGENDGHEGND